MAGKNYTEEQKAEILKKAEETWLTMFISLIVGFVFNMLKLFDIVPTFTENLVMNIVGQVLTFLGLIGVIVDPTTAGFDDSKRAMGYDEPYDDDKPPLKYQEEQ